MTLGLTIALLEGHLGYVFKKKELLAEAITHSSSGGVNYERLEFLGDRVLGVAVGSWLFQRFPLAPEGELSRRHTSLVRESSLVLVGERWGLGDIIIFGGGEARKDSIVADVVEAVLGALWVDGGLEVVETVIERDWAFLVDLKDEKDPKSRLQEWLQGQGFDLPTYEVIEESGPDHDKFFKVMVYTAKGACVGAGRSKHVASADAAQNMMQILEETGNT